MKMFSQLTRPADRKSAGRWALVRRLLVLLALLGGSPAPLLYAQQYVPAWAGARVLRGMPSFSPNETVTDITTDIGGNLYVTGGFDGTIDFGNGVRLAAFDFTHGYVAKFDNTGTCQWAVGGNLQVGGGNAQFDAVRVGPDGEVYVIVPNSNLTTTCGVRLPQGGTGGVGLLKISPTGICRWIRKIVNGGGAQQTLEIDQRGHLFLSGDFFQTVTVGSSVVTGPAAGGDDYFYLARLDTAGRTQWATWVGSGTVAATSPPPYDYKTQLAVDGTGGVFISGTYGSGVFRAGSLTLPPRTARGGYLAHFGAGGACRLLIQPTSSVIVGTGGPMTYDPGNYRIYMQTGGTSVALGGLTSSANSGVQLFCLDSAGVGIRLTQFETANGAAFFSPPVARITLGRDHAIYGTGYAVGSFAQTGGGPVQGPFAANTIAVCRFAPDGTYSWTLPQTTPTQGLAWPTCIADNGPGGVWIGGRLEGRISFGGTTLVSDGADGFLANTGLVLGLPEAAGPAAAELNIWPNPAGAETPVQVQLGAVAGSARPVQLLDALGRVVRTATIAAGERAALVPVAGLAPGVYVVRAGGAARRLVLR